jgi:hypothetical protein
VAARTIADLRDELPDIVMAAQFVAAVGGSAQQTFQITEPVPGQRPAGRGVEQRPAACQQLRRAAAADTQAHAPRAGIVEPDLAVFGFEAARQRSLGAAPLGQPGERELDVLAGAQVVGCEVRAAAEVAAQRTAADGHAVLRAALRVVHAELGEHWLVAQVLQLESLLAAELAAQCGLPVGHGELRRPARARQARFRGFGRLAGPVLWCGFAGALGGHGGCA